MPKTKNSQTTRFITENSSDFSFTSSVSNKPAFHDGPSIYYKDWCYVFKLKKKDVGKRPPLNTTSNYSTPKTKIIYGNTTKITITVSKL